MPISDEYLDIAHYSDSQLAILKLLVEDDGNYSNQKYLSESLGFTSNSITDKAHKLERLGVVEVSKGSGTRATEEGEDAYREFGLYERSVSEILESARSDSEPEREEEVPEEPEDVEDREEGSNSLEEVAESFIPDDYTEKIEGDGESIESKDQSDKDEDKDLGLEEDDAGYEGFT